MRSRRSGHAAVGAVAVLATVAGCGSNDVMPQSVDVETADNAPVSTPPVQGDVESTDSAAVSTPPVQGGRLQIDDVSPVSVPMALTVYLTDVSVAVLDELGSAVWAGASLDEPDTHDVSITIYGTDEARVTEVVDRVALDLRDRITVVETGYSADDLERLAAEAQERLDAAGIDARVGTRWGLDAADVDLVTADGTADPAIERAARDVLDGIPVTIAFAGPLVPLSP